MFFIASSGSLQTETHPGLSPRGTFKSLPLQLELTAAAFGGTWNTQESHWFKGTMFASRDPCTTFSGVHGPGLTCSEFLQFMGVCVCQTHNQLSLYIYPKLVYSRINQILMSYALSCPCNSMHNFLLCSNTSQLSVGALSLFSASAADGNHSWCSVKCKSISFCFVLFCFLLYRFCCFTLSLSSHPLATTTHQSPVSGAHSRPALQHRTEIWEREHLDNKNLT